MAKGQKRSNHETRKPRQPKQAKEAVLAAGSAKPVMAVGPSARQM